MSRAAIRTHIGTLDELRADIALTRDFAYFQTGSVGPVPDSTQRVIMDVLNEENGVSLGGGAGHGSVHSIRERALESLAVLLNVNPHEVTWTQNTSTSGQLVARSLLWKPGDRLAISGSEHVSTRIMARAIDQITGVETTVVPVGPGDSYSPTLFLEQLDRHLTPDHTLFVISLASCVDGRRLPVKEAIEMAHARDVRVMVDGAQAVGVYPVDVRDLDPEFFIGSVHKWLLGPAGSGYLFVAERALPDFNPYLLPASRSDGNGCEPLPLNAMRCTHTGTETMSIPAGSGHAIEIFLRIGMEQVEARIRSLTERLRAGLRHISGFNLLTPESWEWSSGITSIEFPGRTPEQVHALIDAIWDGYRVVVKFQTDFAGIRISTAPFNTEEEVDRLLDALETLIPRM
jgi:selenocysteine lyase/cysteine desulfurase